MVADITHADGVLLVTPKGALSLDELLLLGAGVRAAWEARPERAIVFDFRSARFALTAAKWEQSFKAAARWHYRPEMQMAVVTAPEHLDFFDSRAPRWAQHGIVQSVFTAMSDALSWARARRAPPPPRAARR